MSPVLLKFLIPCILLLASALSGFWLSRLGRPLNNWVFNLHKLTALAAIVLLVLAVIRLCKIHGEGNHIVLSVVLTGIFLLSLLVTGGFLSFERPGNEILRLIHRYLALLAILFVVFMYIAFSGAMNA